MRKIDIGWNGEKYMTRWYLWNGTRLRIYLHCFHRGDYDRRLHDHPHRWGLSLILRGSYLEERLDYMDPFRGPRILQRVCRWYNLLRYTDYHRVVKLLTPRVWTIFICWKHDKRWGFVDWNYNPATMRWEAEYEPFKTGQRYTDEHGAILDTPPQGAKGPSWPSPVNPDTQDASDRTIAGGSVE